MDDSAGMHILSNSRKQLKQKQVGVQSRWFEPYLSG